MTTVRAASELVNDLAARVVAAHDAHEPQRVVGGGSWLDAGRPVVHVGALSVASLTGVVEYVPGDLVLTVRAGTALSEIEAITAEHGQWLALDPSGSAAGTIGATIATASSGPLSLGSGTVRDLVLGLAQITGTGARVQVGGRVVKNVAGFDLVRLATGGFGTLGLLTEVSLRLHARPATDATFVMVHQEVEALLDLVNKLGHGALAFHALEVINPALASAVGVASSGTDARGSGAWALLARATGNSAAVRALRDLLAARGTVHDADGAVWRLLRESDGDGATLRASAPPAHIARTVTQTQLTFASIPFEKSPTMLRVSPHRGSVRITARRIDEMHDEQWAIDLATAIEQLTTHVHRVIGERLPPRAWRVLPAPAADPISRRIRDAYDPHRIMNRGIFGEQDT